MNNVIKLKELGWMKWLKNGARKAFIFHAVVPTLYPFGKNFIG